MTEHEYDCVTCCSLADQLDDALTELEQVKSDHAVLCERSALWFDMKDGKEFQTMWNLLRKTPSQAYVDLKAELEQVKADYAVLAMATTSYSYKGSNKE